MIGQDDVVAGAIEEDDLKFIEKNGLMPEGTSQDPANLSGTIQMITQTGILRNKDILFKPSMATELGDPLTIITFISGDVTFYKVINKMPEESVWVTDADRAAKNSWQ